MANTGSFRREINGFHRQDVTDYLESASQRYETLKKERNELERIRSEQQARLRELEAALAESAAETARLKELEEDNARLRAQLAAEKEAAEAAPREDPAVAEALRGEVEALKEKLLDMEARQAETVQKAEEYDSLRERIATLELNASRRAAGIEQTAQTEAKALLERSEQEGREIVEKARQEAQALLEKAKEEEAAFFLRREEHFRSFRESLLGAARDTEDSTGRLSDELARLSEKLKGIVRALTDTAEGFETGEGGESLRKAEFDGTGCEAAPFGACCGSEDGAACCQGEAPAEESEGAAARHCCDE